VSTEIRLEDFKLYLPTTDTDLSADAWDRVVDTAGDRPNTVTLPALVDPAADHGDEELFQRRQDVDEKHRRVCDLLEAAGYDAMVLGRADSVAWFTSGGDLGQSLSSERSAVLLFITPQSRAVISDNVQSARVFEEELAGLGFQLKERAWYEDPDQIVAELGKNRRVASDNGLFGWPNEMEHLRPLRLALTKLERQRMRVLGRTLAQAVEATCRNFNPGETEADIAGHLAHRLIREGIVPVDLRVASDDRLMRYRQPIFKAAPINKTATIAVTGRRQGLCASLTRIVSFGPAEPQLRAAHQLATMVDATYIFFSRPSETVAGVYRRAKRIYEKFNHPHEWTLDYQGFLVGYSPRETMLCPESPLVIGSDMALSWSPSVGPARSEDTVVIDARGFEVVTDAQRWPKIEVMVKGFLIPRPGILER
jgi:Xaa-Pro aminopeptidase